MKANFSMSWMRTCLAIGVALSCSAAFAADQKDLIGKWRWQQFTIEVTACQGNGLCARVAEGPKNVGMEIFATQLTEKNGNLVGQIVDPNTKETYNTRFQQQADDKWHLDGCNAVRVCLSGDFLRVK